jgi:HTH-type transcriptional regulator/antitoxin MqsA
MKKKTTRYNYGECEICNTPLQEKRVNQDFWIRGELIIVEDVPAGVCPRCGEKIVKADVGRRIANLLGDSGQIAKARRIPVPAIRFDAEEIKV